MAFGNATIGDLKKIAGGGGGGGTSDYLELSNKPSINGVTLSGNKTSSDLGIGGITRTQLNQAPITTTGSTSINISGYKYIEVVFGIYASDTYQVFSNIISVDALTSSDYEVICGGIHPANTAYGVDLRLTAVNNVLSVSHLESKTWSETATIFKIAGIN